MVVINECHVHSKVRSNVIIKKSLRLVAREGKKAREDSNAIIMPRKFAYVVKVPKANRGERNKV